MVLSKFDFWPLLERSRKVWAALEESVDKRDVGVFRDCCFELRGSLYELARFVNERVIPVEGLRGRVLSEVEVSRIVCEKDRFRKRVKGDL